MPGKELFNVASRYLRNKEDAATDADIDEVLREIRAAFTNFSREGKTPLQRGELALLAHNAFEMLKPMYESRSHEGRTPLPPPPPAAQS